MIPTKTEILKWVSKNYILTFFLQVYRTYNFRRIANRDPRKNANSVYKKVFNRDINWDNPKNLIEKIYWLQMYTDTSLWTMCADKYNMRTYVESKDLGYLLPQLYGHWGKASDIDYTKLPNSFVLKTTNGCGQVLLVKDKTKLNLRDTNSLLDEWLKLKYGFTDGQTHYSRIKPCIIAEEFLVNSNQTDNKSLIDYKIQCLNGKAQDILVAYDRIISGPNKGYKLSVYDLDWNNISDKSLSHNNMHYDGTPVERPQTLDEMIALAQKLSNDFFEVRVDFYEINGRLYLGELTFTRGYGSYTESYYNYLGSKLDISKAKRIKGINRPPKL